MLWIYKAACTVQDNFLQLLHMIKRYDNVKDRRECSRHKNMMSHINPWRAITSLTVLAAKMRRGKFFVFFSKITLMG